MVWRGGLQAREFAERVDALVEQERLSEARVAVELESPRARRGELDPQRRGRPVTRLICDGSASSFSSARMSEAGLRVKRTAARSRSMP